MKKNLTLILIIISYAYVYGQNPVNIYVQFSKNINFLQVNKLNGANEIFNLSEIFIDNYQKIEIKNSEDKILTEGDLKNLSKQLSNIYNCSSRESTMCSSNNYFQPVIQPKIIYNFFNNNDIKNCKNKNELFGTLLNTFYLCHCDLICAKELIDFLENSPFIDEIEVEVLQPLNTNAPNYLTCKNFTEHWTEYQMDSLWDKKGGYGDSSKIIIIENENSPNQHCKYEGSLTSFTTEINTNHYHSTAVLGILKSKHDNCDGSLISCKGLVPETKIRSHISFNNSNCSNRSETIDVDTKNMINNRNLSNALAMSILVGELGDIILLPINVKLILKKSGTQSNLPVEVLPHIKTLIEIGHCKGLIFVEAAGNGGKDLKNYLNDAKGIIVGAIGEFNNRNKQKTGYLKNMSVSCPCISLTSDVQSNYGKEITCYQMGMDIVSTNTNNKYCNFMATSAASTIIAGMAASIQSIYFNEKGKYLTPQEMKKLFESNYGIPVFRSRSIFGINSNTGKFLPTGTSLLNGLSELRP